MDQVETEERMVSMEREKHIEKHSDAEDMGALGSGK